MPWLEHFECSKVGCGNHQLLHTLVEEIPWGIPNLITCQNTLKTQNHGIKARRHARVDIPNTVLGGAKKHSAFGLVLSGPRQAPRSVMCDVRTGMPSCYIPIAHWNEVTGCWETAILNNSFSTDFDTGHWMKYSETKWNMLTYPVRSYTLNHLLLPLFIAVMLRMDIYLGKYSTDVNHIFGTQS